MYFHPICPIHLSNESTVITISVDDIRCLKVLPIRYQQIIGEVEVARRMQANVLFCGQFTIGPVTSKNTSRKITSHLDVHILFPLVWSGLVWSDLLLLCPWQTCEWCVYRDVPTRVFKWARALCETLLGRLQGPVAFDTTERCIDRATHQQISEQQR